MSTHRRIIGLDVHPEVFTAAALTGADACQATVDWITESLSLTQLERWVSTQTTPEDLFVLEASGNSFETVARLKALGRTALVLESVRVGQIEKSYCTTDKNSAVKIARVYLSGLAFTVWTPDEVTRTRRDVLQRYLRTRTDLHRARNRLTGWLNSHNACAPTGTRLTRPSGLTELLNLKPWTALQRQLLESMHADLARADQQRRQLAALIALEVTQDPQMFRLLRLFGVRHIVAFALAAFIGDIHRFATPKQLVAYIGLNPRVRFSGQSGYTGSLAHHGRWELRALLVEAAHTILRCKNSPLHTWGWKLLFRKSRNCAVIAVARKLTVAAWYLMQGLFTPLKELDPTLTIKLRKVVTMIGHKTVRQLGFKTSLEFERCLQQKILSA
jgi:transposase